MLIEPNYIEEVASNLSFKSFQVQIVLEMINEWDTIPFIARYRKEKTWNLDENNIREIIDLQRKKESLYKMKVTAINWIEELWKMTPELLENIVNAKTLKEVEEIYKPYKSKKKTKAMIAIEKWFQIVADALKKNIDIAKALSKWEIERGLELFKKYSLEEILLWASDIISAEISANSVLRETLRHDLLNSWTIVSKIKTKASLEKLNDKDKWQISKFEIYSDFEASVSTLKPYQILALNRWEDIWIINVKIRKDEESHDLLHEEYSKILNISNNFISLLKEAFSDGYTVLFKSVENEVRWILSELWEDDAIRTFQTNLEALLMSVPEYWKKILAIDPGYRAWCKMCVLDELWNPVLFDKIFLHSLSSSKEKLKEIFKKLKIDVVVVWNWTGSDETVSLIQEISDIEIFIVNESWASVYSASKIAAEEFPKLDSLDRWTVSIWRRFIDPLSELVKVPVWSIGVGMYQHDIKEKKLEEKLWFVVEDVVNNVWINVNTASSYVLNHIAGIDKRWAKKIYNHRPYKSRSDLKKQLSDKIYEQAIWFLRVPESKEKLDNTDIHPDQYELARFIQEPYPWISSPLQEKEATELYWKYEIELKKIYPDVNVWTIEFIINSYNNIWKDPRVNSTHKKAGKKVDIETISEWDIVNWVVRNVVAFWAFVDIWLKNDWLVHVSQIADTFVKDPMDFVEVWENVKVKITWIDKEKGKIQLSMKGL